MRKRLLRKALATCLQVQDPLEQADVLSAVWAAGSDIDNETADLAYGQMLAAFSKIRSRNMRLGRYARAARRARLLGRTDQAGALLDLAQKTHADMRRSDAFATGEFAEELVQQGRIDEALGVAPSLGQRKRDEIKELVVKYLCTEGALEQAADVADTITPDGDCRRAAEAALAAAFLETGLIWQGAERLASIRCPTQRALATIDLARKLPEHLQVPDNQKMTLGPPFVLIGIPADTPDGLPTQARGTFFDETARRVAAELAELEWLRRYWSRDAGCPLTYDFAVSLSGSPEDALQARDALSAEDAVVRVLVVRQDQANLVVGGNYAVVAVADPQEATAAIRALLEPIWLPGWMALDSREIANAIHGRTCRRVAVAEFKGDSEQCVGSVVAQLQPLTQSADRLYISFSLGSQTPPSLDVADLMVRNVAEKVAGLGEVVFSVPVSTSKPASTLAALPFTPCSLLPFTNNGET